MSGEGLTPHEEEVANSLLMEAYKADPANWRTDERGWRYYVGPRMSGDGTIDYSDSDGRPE